MRRLFALRDELPKIAAGEHVDEVRNLALQRDSKADVGNAGCSDSIGAAAPSWALYRLPHAAQKLLAKADQTRLVAGTSTPPKGFPANPSNITPDPETGIGRWSESDFVQTMRTGVNPAGIHLHAFMPWHEMGRMSDDDLRALYRYLRTTPAIRNEVKRRERTDSQ